jgi:hypothetical protein
MIKAANYMIGLLMLLCLGGCVGFGLMPGWAFNFSTFPALLCTINYAIESTVSRGLIN